MLLETSDNFVQLVAFVNPNSLSAGGAQIYMNRILCRKHTVIQILILGCHKYVVHV